VIKLFSFALFLRTDDSVCWRCRSRSSSEWWWV